MRRSRKALAARQAAAEAELDRLGESALAGVEPIRDARWRRRVRVAGRVVAMRVQPWADTASLEITVSDDSAAMVAVFLGRRRIPGIGLGTRLVLDGTATDVRGQLAVMNPAYQLLPVALDLPRVDEGGQPAG